jgi:hypothetical protein
MPTFDAGYCFLTALLPISTQYVVRTGGTESSPVELVREALSQLAPAHQSPRTMAGPDGPFARDGKTHFARLAVIDNTIFNGRMPTDALFDQSDRLIAQPVDELNCPYLMVVVDFDAPKGDTAELRDYLEDFWTHAAAEIKPVFKHCFDFPKEADGKGFAQYVIARQIDTTMPFNDYRPDDTPLKASTAKVSNGGVFGILKNAFAVINPRSRHFPFKEGSDLPSVLKALHLQRKFGAFVIKAQNDLLTDAELQASFARFVTEHRPDQNGLPTQEAGRIPLCRGN